MKYPEITIIKHPMLMENLTAQRNETRPRGKFAKIVCDDVEKLKAFAKEHSVPEGWIHLSRNGTPHIDIWGRRATRFYTMLLDRRVIIINRYPNDRKEKS